jgi:hypothetical protein
MSFHPFDDADLRIVAIAVRSLAGSSECATSDRSNLELVYKSFGKSDTALGAISRLSGQLQHAVVQALFFLSTNASVRHDLEINEVDDVRILCLLYRLGAILSK